MTNLLRRFKCWLGWHEWEYQYVIDFQNGSFPVGDYCKHCGKVKP